MKSFFDLIVTLPVSFTLTVFWNFGSMLAMVLFFQIFSGVLLAMKFVPLDFYSFFSVYSIMLESSFGFILRILHFNGASLFFLFIYLHLFKGLFFFSYRLKSMWSSGIIMLFLLMMISFVGYVLPWAQMSFWACAVITNLFSIIPFFGPSIVLWIWGGFVVGGPTLNVFFVLHFLFPFVLFIFVFLHLILLHLTGSTSSLFCVSDSINKISFHPFYTTKDLYNIIFWFFFFFFSLSFPFVLGDAEMFIEAQPLSSPLMIVPEWYFLVAYAVLRSIPNKILGVIFLMLSVFIFFFFIFVNITGFVFSIKNKFLVFIFFFICLVLTWIGQCHVEYPFVQIGVIFTFFYFFVITSMMSIALLDDFVFF